MGAWDASNFYIDYKSKEKLQDQSAGLIYLLECLGFTINQDKTTLEPSQSLVFLGFTVDTTVKPRNTQLTTGQNQENQNRSSKLLGVELVSTCSLSWLLGKMNAMNEVSIHEFWTKSAPLFLCHLQMDLAAALRTDKTQLSLSLASREKLIWWDTQMVKWNGTLVLIKDQPNLIVDSDASNLVLGCIRSTFEHQGSMISTREN